MAMETILYEWWLEDEDPKESPPHISSKKPKHSHGTGKRFTFHGAFKSKADAKKKEKEVEGSFIVEKNGRFYVMKEKK